MKEPEIEAKMAKKFHAQVGDVPYEWVIDLTPSESFRFMTYQLMLADKLLCSESTSNEKRGKVKRSYTSYNSKSIWDSETPNANDLFSI